MKMLWAVLASMLVFTIAACGDDDSDGDGGASASTDGETLTIYSSLPLQGAARPLAVSIENGIKLAAQQSGNRAGEFRIKYISLDDSTAAAGTWDPAQVSSNAREVVRDESAIAYIGELNSGATVVSLPILNEMPILQVSPANTYIGLTRSEGAAPGEPEMYYPTGERTFARPIPADHIMAAAQVAYQKEQGCTRLFLLSDGEVGGHGQAELVSDLAPDEGIEVLGLDKIDPKATNYRSLAARIDSEGADCMFFGGVSANNAARLWLDVHAANPEIKMFGTDGVAENEFAADIGDAGRVTFITNATLDAKSYPPEGQQFFEEYRRQFDIDPEAYAIYGYESMMSVLAAIEAAGPDGDDRQAVIDAYFDIEERDSVLGTYSIDENGDTTLRQFGGYRVSDGELVFDHAIDAGEG